MNTSTKTILLSVALAFSAMPGLGCDEDGDGAGIIEEIQIEGSCSDYCEKAAECNSNVDADACQSDCESTVTDCQADEQAETLNQLDECSEDACNEFGVCTVGAGLQCAFGI